MPFKIGQLLLTPGQKSNKIWDVYVAQPGLEKEKIAGIVFALLEIDNKSSNQLKFVEVVINSFNKFYYENEKLLLREKIATVKTELIFETTLAKINRSIAELFENDKNFLDAKDINITLGAMHENNLHFASIGYNKIILIHPDKSQNPKNINKKAEVKETVKKTQYKITDIAGKDEKSIPVSPDKFFSNIVSGIVPEGSYVVFSNETLHEYISGRQLIEVITKLPPASAVEQIKNILSGINRLLPFLAIIVKNTATTSQENFKNITLPYKAPTHAGESIINLNSTEEITEKLLSPSGIINFQKWINKIFSNRLVNKNQKIANIKRKTFLMPVKPLFLIYSYIKKFFLNSAAIIYYLLKYLFRRGNGRRFFSSLASLPKNIFLYLKSLIPWFINLHLKYKLMFIIISACLFLFAYNIIMTTNHKQISENKNRLDNLITTIVQKQNAVDADLLYNNKDGAKKTISEIENMLNQLPISTAAEQEQRNTFLNKFNKQLEKVRLSVNLTEFKELADLSKIDPLAKPALITINDENDKIFVNDGLSNKIYPVNLKEGMITSINFGDMDSKALSFPTNTMESGYIVYLNKEGAYKIKTKTNEISKIPFGSFLDFENITAAAGYNSKYYLTNKQLNQILLYSQSNGKLTLAQNWLKDNTDTKNTISMCIDGNLYLLQNNGTILKLAKGKKIEFSQEIIAPPLTSPEKIVTSADLQYLYILELKEKRVIVFDKNGKLYIQYHFTVLESLTDFTVSEKDKKLYILSGTKILSFDMKQIQ